MSEIQLKNHLINEDYQTISIKEFLNRNKLNYNGKNQLNILIVQVVQMQICADKLPKLI